MRRRAAVLGMLLVAGCGESLTGYGARYTGALRDCGLSLSTLARRGDQFVFTPGDGALTLAGPVAADGGFAGELNTQPPGKPPFLLRVSGKFEGEQARVSYSTPGCRASGRFSRVRPPSF